MFHRNLYTPYASTVSVLYIRTTTLWYVHTVCTVYHSMRTCSLLARTVDLIDVRICFVKSVSKSAQYSVFSQTEGLKL